MADEKKWFVQKDNKVYGPYSSRQLQELAQSSKITPDSLVRIGSEGGWSKAGRVKGLFASGTQVASSRSEGSGQSNQSQSSSNQLYVRRNGQVAGPLTLDKIKALMRADKLSSADYVATTRNGPWKSLTANLLKAIGDVLAKQEDVYAEPVVVEVAEAEDEEDSWLSDQDSFDKIVRETKKARSVPLPSRIEDDEEDEVDEDDEEESRPSRTRTRETPRKKKKKKKARSRGRGGLASPLQRLFAVIMDGVFVILAVAPSVIAILLFKQMKNPDEPAPVLSTIVVLLFFGGLLTLGGFNLFLLFTNGQTLGKWFCNIQIVDIETGEPAGFLKGWLLRTFVNQLIGGIPFIGAIYALADICFIFAEDHRCLHDHIAGTQVVDL